MKCKENDYIIASSQTQVVYVICEKEFRIIYSIPKVDSVLICHIEVTSTT